PVKSTGDLLALRSDAYVVTPDDRLVLAGERDGQPPAIELDAHYKMLPEFDEAFASVPSLIRCETLKVTGKIRFSPGVTCRGKVGFVNSGPGTQPVLPGEYVN